MATARNSTVTTKYPVSNDVISWIESVTGLLAHIRITYGGVPELIEHPQWDQSRSAYAANLLAALKKDVARTEKEFRDHVHGCA